MSNFADYVKYIINQVPGGAGSAHLREKIYSQRGGPDGGDGGGGRACYC